MCASMRDNMKVYHIFSTKWSDCPSLTFLHKEDADAAAGIIGGLVGEGEVFESLPEWAREESEKDA